MVKNSSAPNGESPTLRKQLLSMALVLPLAACGSTHGSSGEVAAQSGGSVVSDGSPAGGTVTGTVDRSGANNTTNTSDGGKSTIGSAVTAGMDGSAGTALMVTTIGSPKPVATATPVPAAAPIVAANKRSISGWVSCGLTQDDTAGAIKAFAAAKQNAFTLVVDCPVHLHSGMAIDRGIFIDNGTSVEFTGNGKFYVDNLFHPAFVIANSSNVTLTNWNVEWDGTVPINSDVGGYELDGKFVAGAGRTQPAGAFNDFVLSKWLTANRGVKFDDSQGWVKSIWAGGVNPMAVFYLTGDTSNVVFTGLKLSVPANAGGDHYMPMAVSFSLNWKSNQTVSGKSAHAAAVAAVPHEITFSGIDIDGTLMGWQGNLRNAMFENVTSHRYGDLQDSRGQTSGGLGKWFPPPHLFYLNYDYDGDPGLFNTNIHITNVVDEGIRSGTARDKGGSDSVSGYALSLKLGCTECSVDNYSSSRPDGFMDLLPSDNLLVSNVKATFDSSFINNAFPAALRFPGALYTRITLENVAFNDVAASTMKGPIANAPYPSNESIVFNNVSLSIKNWAGSDLPLPKIAGSNNNVDINYIMQSQSMKVAYAIKGVVTSTLQASPINVQTGGSTKLVWSAKDAGSCSASGAWSGGLGSGGSKVVKIGAAGSSNFGLNCQSTGAFLSSALSVLSQ